ncbi:MAG: KEOPS complex subunit Cgi121 [Candidatus Methanomethylophilus sp.]|nr:KEOPS complex subunit Cgi121 [Methanomethylophilus sp.]
MAGAVTDVQVIGIRGHVSFDAIVRHFAALGGEVVLLDPAKVCGKDHVRSAVLHADRAFAEGSNRSKTLLTEIILYTAGERQIGRALKEMRPAPDADAMVAAVLNVKGDLQLEKLGVTRDDSLCDATEEKAKNLGIPLYPDVSVADAALEFVAGVDLLKQ